VSPGNLLRRLDQRVVPPLGRALHRLGRGATRLHPLTLVALCSVLAVLLAAGWVANRGPTPASDSTHGDVAYVGVVQGASIPEYVAASRRELDALLAASPAAGSAGPAGTELYALVSFTGYLAPERLTAVAGVAVVQVYARVPLPQIQTEIVRIPAASVPDDVIEGMAGIAARKDGDVAWYRQRASELTGDDAARSEQRARYASDADVAAAEAAAYRSLCSCVYAAVVRATAAALDGIAARAEVRAVDPAPEVKRVDRTVFTPPLPEQTDLAKPPPDRVVGQPADAVPPGD
jgi:hypothetical protein